MQISSIMITIKRTFTWIPKKRKVELLAYLLLAILHLSKTRSQCKDFDVHNPKKNFEMLLKQFSYFFSTQIRNTILWFWRIGSFMEVWWKCHVLNLKPRLSQLLPPNLFSCIQVRSGRVGSIHVDNLFIARNSLMCIVHIVELCSF